jgi:hypothetical protein
MKMIRIHFRHPTSHKFVNEILCEGDTPYPRGCLYRFVMTGNSQ